MAHQHVHSHNHTLTSLNSIFIVCIIINLLFVIIEAGAGFLFNSLGLLSDAGHNLSDVFSLLLSLFAFRMSKHHSTDHFTYGIGFSAQCHYPIDCGRSYYHRKFL